METDRRQQESMLPCQLKKNSVVMIALSVATFTNNNSPTISYF
jgi:hypothetical protein